MVIIWLNVMNLKLYEHNQYLLDQKSDQLHEMIEQEQIPNILNIDNIDEFNQKL